MNARQALKIAAQNNGWHTVKAQFLLDAYARNNELVEIIFTAGGAISTLRVRNEAGQWQFVLHSECVEHFGNRRGYAEHVMGKPQAV